MNKIIENICKEVVLLGSVTLFSCYLLIVNQAILISLMANVPQSFDHASLARIDIRSNTYWFFCLALPNTAKSFVFFA